MLLNNVNSSMSPTAKPSDKPANEPITTSAITAENERLTNRVTDLESRLIYAEQANDQLSHEIYEQQREAEKTQLRLRRLEQRFQEFTEQMPAGSSNSLEDEVPPHY